jgi:hypothetical protein
MMCDPKPSKSVVRVGLWHNVRNIHTLNSSGFQNELASCADAGAEMGLWDSETNDL